MQSYIDFFQENLDNKVNLFLEEVASYLEKERNVDNSKFKMYNIFCKKSKNRFKNIYLNNNNYNISNKYNESDMSDDDLCIAVLKSGKNKGQLCNKSVYIGKYCKKHCRSDCPTDIDKVENKDEISCKINNEIENEVREENVKNEIINNKETVKEDYDKSKIIIDINKFGNFVFGDTGLVFNNEKHIVAKEGPNGEWITLSESDIDLCKKYKLRYKHIIHERKIPESTKVITRNFNILSNDWDD